ncbi:MAG: ThiF family adenylyltransferase [Deltaproteobacteria bacterium]
MENILVCPESKFNKLNNHLLQNEKEQIAFLLCSISKRPNQTRLLCKELIKAGPSHLAYNSESGAALKNGFFRKILKRSKQESLSLIICHSHPFSDHEACFSMIDEACDQKMASYISKKIPGPLFGTMVVAGSGNFQTRIYDKAAEKMVAIDQVWIIGRNISKYPEKSKEYDYQPFIRQVLLFGCSGQDKLADTTIAIVGLGGIGSLVAEMVCRLGVGKLIAIDFDVVEACNLNRLVGATPTDVGRAKVEVFKTHAERYSETQIEAICESVLHPSLIERIKEAQVIFCCVDKQAPRFFLNDVAVKYSIPLIDLATGVVTEKGYVEAGGQVRIVVPDGFCLSCIDGIDRNEVIQELLTEEDIQMRAGAGYIQGESFPAPSVISLNGVIASLGVTEFINLVCGIRKANTFVAYDMISNQVLSQTLKAKRNKKCLTCHEKGIRAMGDLIPFPNLFDDKTPNNIPDIAMGQEYGGGQDGRSF